MGPGTQLERTAAARERARKRLTESMPRWYNPWLHLAATTGIGVACLVLGAVEVRHPTALELLVVPAVWLVANGFEWRAHKDILHKRVWPLEPIYDQHTPNHHAVYMTTDLEIRSYDEFRFVLMPAMGVLGIVVAMAPLAALVGLLLGANAGWLTLVSGGTYMVLYEISHLTYHLPSESFIGRLALVRVLRKHHARHHDPRLMNKWNFNVTIPLFDWLHGTIAPPELVALAENDRADARDAARATVP